MLPMCFSVGSCSLSAFLLLLLPCLLPLPLANHDHLLPPPQVNENAYLVVAMRTVLGAQLFLINLIPLLRAGGGGEVVAAAVLGDE